MNLNVPVGEIYVNGLVRVAKYCYYNLLGKGSKKKKFLDEAAKSVLKCRLIEQPTHFPIPFWSEIPCFIQSDSSGHPTNCVMKT